LPLVGHPWEGIGQPRSFDHERQVYASWLGEVEWDFSR
jgi:hypothetical protein